MIYGANHQYVESYKYATVGEAEALVNLPESAQEPLTRDIPKKGLQQRRQALQSILTELQALEVQEARSPNLRRSRGSARPQLAHIIHDSSSRKCGVARRDGRADPRGSEADLTQSVDRPSGESTIAAEVLMNVG